MSDIMFDHRFVCSLVVLGRKEFSWRRNLHFSLDKNLGYK